MNQAFAAREQVVPVIHVGDVRGTANLLLNVALVCVTNRRRFDVRSKLQCDGPVQRRTRRGGIVDQLRGRVKVLTFLMDARALAMRQITDA